MPLGIKSFLDQTRQRTLSRTVMVLFVMSLLGGGCPHPASARDDDTTVRIAILKDVKQADMKIPRGYEIIDPLTSQQLEEGRRGLSRTEISAGPDGIRLGARLFKVKRIRFIPRQYFSLFADRKERKYRGAVDVLLTETQQLLFVNVISIESYIKGVLYHEVSHRWPLEAIKAQAVAARTYAAFQIQQNKKKDYDMTNDIYSQVYGGKTSERYRTNLAVQRTQGDILVFDGKILPAYYHATCGGRTEDVQEVWKHNLYPLKGVRCVFCSHSPHYFWKKNIQLQEIQEKLNQHGHKIGLIKSIEIREHTSSGRVKTLEIVGRKGEKLTLSGKDFREIMGPNVLRSNDYRVFMKGYYCDFIGKGWGHGVGMCQWGAMGMARQQYSYDAILTYYYPGSELKTLSEVKHLLK